MRSGASLRLAVLAAALTALGTMIAVVPLLHQLTLELELEARQDMQALVSMALVQPSEVPSWAMDGWIGIASSGAAASAEPAALALAPLCPVPLPRDGLLAFGPVRVGDAWVLGACGVTARGTTMMGWREAPSLASWTRHIFRLALLVACLSGGVVFVSASRLLAPLGRIAQFARSLKQKESPSPLPTSGDPELGALSTALNQLSSELAAREDEIQARLQLTQELGSVVAHEVRNPLQSVTMLADLLAHEQDPTERARTLQELQAELLLIEQVVQRLLSSEGNLRLVHKPLDLGVLLRRALSLHKPRADQLGLSLTWTLPGGELLVNGDAPLLRRAVENLLQNAIAVLGEAGGSVVHLALVLESEQVLIAVEDDGPGVSPELRQEIFKSGVSMRRGGSGVGLGLARRVVQAHGGTLEVDESPLGGARFLITLPGASA